MAATFQRITPFLWFNGQAEEAAQFYVGIFDNSRIIDTQRYSKAAAQASGRPEGSTMTVAFELDGSAFTALNGGPHFRFTEAVSFVVHCRSQAEVDRYWDALSAGGEPKAQQCGWLKDRYGVSWQIVPDEMIRLISDPHTGSKAMAAVMQMKKIDLDAIRRAAQ